MLDDIGRRPAALPGRAEQGGQKPLQATVHLRLVALVVRTQAGQLQVGPIVAHGNDRRRHRQQAQDFLVTHAVESDTP